VFLALDIPREMRMRHIIIRDLSSSTIFLRYFIKGKLLEKKSY
jgi:hypothetical protein